MSKQDLSFESLVENTGASLPAERGRVNTALMQIRQAMPGLDDAELALEISHRCLLYRKVYPDLSLSANALAQNWLRVVAESDRLERPREGLNRHSSGDCETCGGDKAVLVSMRRPLQSEWQLAHGLKASTDSLHEECAPCPDCVGTISGVRLPDPAKVREMMKG